VKFADVNAELNFVCVTMLMLKSNLELDCVVTCVVEKNSELEAQFYITPDVASID